MDATPCVTFRSGKFEFTMQLEDKDFLGEMLSWNAIAAGVKLDAAETCCHAAAYICACKTAA